MFFKQKSLENDSFCVIHKKAFWNQNNEYDLWLAADHGMDNQRQWFFFQVKNMKQNTVYR